jgi:hypothetical protein
MVVYIRLLLEDEIYTRTEIIKKLAIANRTFYKYYIEKMDMEPDRVAGKTKFYKGSTVNTVSKVLDADQRTPFMLAEHEFVLMHYDDTGELLDVDEMNLSKTWTDEQFKELEKYL